MSNALTNFMEPEYDLNQLKRNYFVLVWWYVQLFEYSYEDEN